MPIKQYKTNPILTIGVGKDKLEPQLSLLQELLTLRGHTDPEDIERFLNPDYDAHVHDPFLLKDMDKAVERVLAAIRGEEKVVIYSDYDTDGIPGGVVLHDFFKKVGFKNFTNYIPHRHDEGFGLNSDAVKQFIADGVKLLITIDCGIADVSQVTEAKDAGIDVVITDHHLPGKIVPPAYAIINPKQAGCEYPEKMLCGSGVIFKLIQGVLARDRLGLKQGHEKWLLDMVGLATLSDMVPLVGENRVFAYYGLTVLRRSPRLGLMKLLRQANVNQRFLTEDDIAFMVSPRINAASRMGVPMDAFSLLSTTDQTEADHFATHLNTINNERKGIVAALVKEAKKIIRERFGGAHGGGADAESKMPGVIVIGNPEWKPALLGLAANSCGEEFGCPVFLWGRDGDGVIKGSCRSDGVTDLVALMHETPTGTFLQFGGHAMSGGFSVTNDMIHTLPETLNKAFDGVKKARKGPPEVLVDKELLLADVNWDTYRMIEKLAPFGVGNPKPLFIFRNIVPVEVREFGKEKNHLEIIFENVTDYFSGQPNKVSAIGFFMTASDWKEAAALGHDIIVGKPITLVANLEKSMFRGRKELRLRIVDIIAATII